MTAPAETAREVTSHLYASARVTARGIRFGHAWSSESGPRATVPFSADAYVTLSSAAHAEALIAAATKARDALAELEASAPPTTPEERADFEAWRTARAHEAALGPLPGDDSTGGGA